MLYFVSKIGLSIPISNCKISNESLSNIAKGIGEVNRDIIKFYTLIVCLISKECKCNPSKTVGTGIMTFRKCLFTFIFGRKTLYSRYNILKETYKDKSKAWYLIKGY